jgi:hypothetical protein
LTDLAGHGRSKRAETWRIPAKAFLIHYPDGDFEYDFTRQALPEIGNTSTGSDRTTSSRGFRRMRSSPAVHSGCGKVGFPSSGSTMRERSAAERVSRASSRRSTPRNSPRAVVAIQNVTPWLGRLRRSFL